MSGPDDPLRPVATIGENAAALAISEIGANYLGPDGNGFETSMHGWDGLPEFWCADFVKWAWRGAGADVEGLDAAAGSFGQYGKKHDTFHGAEDPGYVPQVGDAVLCNYNGNDKASHVAIVSRVNDDGTIETISGDYGGEEGGTDAHFAETASVVVNGPAFAPIVGTAPRGLGQMISAFVSPVPANPPQDAALHLETGPDYGVRVGEAQQVCAVAHPSCLHSGGQPVITGSSTIFVGPDQVPLAGHGDRTADGHSIHDRTDDHVYMV